MIKDFETFHKLYPQAKFPVPDEEHVPHYLASMLAAARRDPPGDYAWLPQALRDFEQLEQDAPYFRAAIPDWRNELHDHLLQRLDAVCRAVTGEGWKEWRRPMNFQLSFPQIDAVEANYGQVLARIDLRCAAYNVLREVDPSLPELWEDLCFELRLPAAIKFSKAFRQSVLGLHGLDPKWQQRQQSLATDAMALQLERLIPDFRERLVRRSPDELVFQVSRQEELWQAQEVADGCSLPARLELFRLRRLSYMRGSTWETLESTAGRDAELDAPISVRVVGLRSFAVPGNRHYLWLTRAVLGQLVTHPMDLEYLDDGQLARWAFDYNREPMYLSENGK